MRVDGNIHYVEQTITAGELGLAVHGVLKRTDPHCDQPFALASQGNFDGKGVHTGVRKDDQDLACSSVEATHQGCTDPFNPFEAVQDSLQAYRAYIRQAAGT